MDFDAQKTLSDLLETRRQLQENKQNPELDSYLDTLQGQAMDAIDQFSQRGLNALRQPEFTQSLTVAMEEGLGGDFIATFRDYLNSMIVDFRNESSNAKTPAWLNDAATVDHRLNHGAGLAAAALTPSIPQWMLQISLDLQASKQSPDKLVARMVQEVEEGREHAKVLVNRSIHEARGMGGVFGQVMGGQGNSRSTLDKLDVLILNRNSRIGTDADGDFAAGFCGELAQALKYVALRSAALKQVALRSAPVRRDRM